jgi:hypothetical protein
VWGRNGENQLRAFSRNEEQTLLPESPILPIPDSPRLPVSLSPRLPVSLSPFLPVSVSPRLRFSPSPFPVSLPIHSLLTSPNNRSNTSATSLTEMRSIVPGSFTRIPQGNSAAGLPYLSCTASSYLFTTQSTLR